jgi:hypothetical protein
MSQESKFSLMELAQVELNPRSTLLKFYLALGLGAFVTLSICPQFGLGPIGGGHGIGHWVMSYGPLVCGAYCGAIFLGIGMLVAISVLRTPEWRWVWRHHVTLTLIPSVGLFFLLMLFKWFFQTEAMHETFSYYAGWIIMGVGISLMIMQVAHKWRHS